MKREEALKLVGKPVFAGCWAGSYGGILKELTESKPWRGIVILKSVVEFPFPTYGNFVKPLRYNMERSFGHPNITPFVGKLPEYKESMIEAFFNLIKQLEKHPDTLVKKGVKSLKENEWLVKHPDYMGGWKKSDMPKLES